MIAMLKATLKERIIMRNYILAENGPTISILDNLDGTWVADVNGILFESGSAAELLRELANILEES